MKKFLIILVGLGIIITVIYFSQSKEVQVLQPVTQAPTTNETTKPISLCFYKENRTASGFYDVSWLKMNLQGEKVDGEFNYIPAEKDKKVGKFEGKVGAVDKVAMARTADVWWKSMAEGMEAKEELRIVFGEGSAQVGFGEMVDNGDGSYVYKDKSKLTYSDPMTDTDCGEIPLKLAVIDMRSANTCYAYHQESTPETPYKVDEYINIKITSNTITGTKKGNQSGPDMTNGYSGTLKGTLDAFTISSLFSYTIEGSKNVEKEIYNVVPTGLEKLHYPLVEEAKMLVPDTTKEAKKMEYSKVDCKGIK